MPQHHDIGWKKRQPASTPKTTPDTDKLALKLVENGLATAQILEVRNPTKRHQK